MRLCSAILCAVLSFNAAARVFSQTAALCAKARANRTAGFAAGPAASALASVSRARRRRPSIVHVSFAVSAIARPALSSRLDSLAAALSESPAESESAPPDHPPA